MQTCLLSMITISKTIKYSYNNPLDFCLNVFFFQAIRLSLEQALPAEPDEESGEQISKLRIRTPSGEFLERRFLGSCKLQVLFDFVASKGFPFEEFKILTTFPRRNVSIQHIFLMQNIFSLCYIFMTSDIHSLQHSTKLLCTQGRKDSCSYILSHLGSIELQGCEFRDSLVSLFHQTSVLI